MDCAMKLFVLLSVFVVITLHMTCGSSSYFGGHRRFGFVGEPSVEVVNSDGIENKWIVQRLDNFNKSNKATWFNRYFENDEWYVDGGPIFLMFRGEDYASKGFMVAGAWTEYAKKYNAMLFQLEQRFYGFSLPTNNLDLNSLQYLTSEQMLADAANFIRTMNDWYGFAANQKWIMFGGSYAGSLAIWMVEKYPKLAYGAISSSGPVNVIVDFEGYLNSVTEGLAIYSPECPIAVRKAYEAIEENLHSANGQKYLTSVLNLCSPMHDPSKDDVSNLFYGVTGDFMDAVQYNGTNTDVSSVNINVVCETMLNKTGGTYLERLGEVNKLYMVEQYEGCLDFEYDKMIKELRNSSIYAKVAYGDRQWFYQTCAEFGFFQTSDGKTEVFGKSFPLPYFIEECLRVFGPKFDKSFINSRVSKTLKTFKGVHPTVSNVLSVQGSTDPWHLRGIYKNYTKTGGVRAIYIPGTAHCADMYSALPTDPPQLTEARNEIREYIGKILGFSTSSSYSSSS